MNTPLYAQVVDIIRHQALARQGYDDVFTLADLASSTRLQVTQAGGGLIVHAASAAHIRELHVIPHGGIELGPAELDLLQPTDPDTIAGTILINNDAGVAAIASHLAASIASGRTDRALAWFRIPRILLDANRASLQDQFAAPYRGAELRRPLTAPHRRRYAAATFTPWVEAIIALLRSHPITVTHHHHSYDQIGTGAVAYERSAGEIRPAGMFLRRYWHVDELGERTGRDGHYIDADLLMDLQDIYRSHLQHIEAFPLVTTDWPYESPYALPQLVAQHDTRLIQRVFYEARKDLLRGQHGLTTLIQAIEAMAARAASYAA